MNLSTFYKIVLTIHDFIVTKTINKIKKPFPKKETLYSKLSMQFPYALYLTAKPFKNLRAKLSPQSL